MDSMSSNRNGNSFSESEYYESVEPNEDRYSQHYFQSADKQFYEDRLDFSTTDDLPDNRSAFKGQQARGWKQNFQQGQRQNYSRNMRAGKSSRVDNGPGNADRDGAAKGSHSARSQEDEVSSGSAKLLPKNSSETANQDSFGDVDFQRKQTSRKMNRDYDNFSKTEGRNFADFHGRQAVNDDGLNAHEQKKRFLQSSNRPRSYNSSNGELGTRYGSDHYERGYHAGSRDWGRRKPDSRFRDYDVENWGSRSERRDVGRDYEKFRLGNQTERDTNETDLFAPRASEKLDLPLDSHGNSSSSKSSTGHQNTRMGNKSVSSRDQRSNGDRHVEKPDRYPAQSTSISDARHGFQKPERNSQAGTYDPHAERNYNSQENTKQAKGRARDLKETGGHYKQVTNKSQDSYQKFVQNKPQSRNVPGSAGSRYQNRGGKHYENSNEDQKPLRCNNEGESHNSHSDNQRTSQEKTAECSAFGSNLQDNILGNKVAAKEKEVHDSLQDESNCLESQKTEVADGKDSQGSRNAEIVSSRVKDSVPVKGFNNQSKHPASGQWRQASKWQDETQRSLLIEHLSSGKYECLVCCNAIRREAAIWGCSNCYHIYHMYCIKKWAQSPAATASTETAGAGWRCPTCQNPYLQIPNQYTCFCGKMKDPEFNHYSTPHSCNETCGKERSKGCPHKCNLLCHPGPCPPCSAFIMRSCDCGKAKRSVKCAGDATSFKCGEPCHRTLNCGSHECQSLCHSGQCEPCEVTIEQKCYCEQETRTVKCGSAESFSRLFSCGRVCSRKLGCGLHTCGEICHAGPCDECPLRPSAVTRCPCGKTLLAEIKGSKPREACEDPIPTCGKTCGLELQCGNEGAKHRCKQRCHDGPCAATCDRTTEVTCRCGAVSKELPCAEFMKITESSPFKCDRRCKKKMSCGRHKCNQLCCVSTEHQCELLCGYKLSCGIHKCEERCHRGNCPSCWQVNFDELRCHCGAEVIYPPVPCGAKPPECNRPCTREHPCSHQATHHCHSESSCPPCTVLTQKWCLGHHELRYNIPCYVSEISCGMQCGKELPCVIHKCLQACHKGACLLEDQVCTQPCPMIRERCGHPCQMPCHQGSPCPATACKAEITLQCECGRRKEKGLCLCGSDAGSQNDYTKMTAQLVASKLWEGQSIDLSVLTKEVGINKKTRRLQCNSECAIMERNQRLALALEIKNPDLSSKLGNPPYSQFLKDFAKQNPTFVANVEKALSGLVTAAQQVKVNRKSHPFKVMPSAQRRVIHELAEFYGCQTESYDEEPNKNVVATAVKGKCWLPNVTLTALVQRELFPKAPMPIPINCKEEQIRSAAQGAKQSTEVLGTAKTHGGNFKRLKEPQIDYFDVTD